MNLRERVGSKLVWLRFGIFVVFLAWTLDKFVTPGHAGKVFENFYGLSGLGTEVLYVLAGVELLVILAFVLGTFKTWTYGFVLVFHGISTLSTYEQYIPGYGADVNLLFFAAWPMLAACYVLFALRDLDNHWTISS